MKVTLRNPHRCLVALLAWILGPVVIVAAAAAATPDPTPLTVTPSPRPGFTLLPATATGVVFTNRLSDAGAASNQIRLNGSGVALGDIDRDGLPDLFFCGLETPNRLYRNLGNWRFADVPLDPALAMEGRFASGAAFADVDGDGDTDLLVNALGEGTRLFLNDGRGAFTERADSGLMRRGGASSLTLADVDGDGDLDLYVANYRTQTVRTTGVPMLNVGGKRTIPPQLKDDLEITADGRVLEHGEPDLFYLNLGGGRFQLESWTAGRFLDEDGRPLTRIPRDWGLACVFRDINQDGLPDLYVCNDFHSEDRLWINIGNGRFRAAPRLALRNTSTFSMSVDFADLDRDGWDDFFVSDMLDLRRDLRLSQIAAASPSLSKPGVFDDRPQYGRNTLQINRGDGTYAELARFAGLERSGWTWGVVFLDVDLDGYEDLLLTTGHLFNIQDLDAAARIERMGPFRREQLPGKLLLYPKATWPKLAFRNDRHLGFSEHGQPWGFGDPGIAHGIAIADLDGDGDADLAVNNLNAAAGLYRNDSSAPRVRIRLRGRPPNTDGIGARVSLVTPVLIQSQEIQTGGRYLSSDAPERIFAWPSNTAPGTASIVIHWRNGRRQTIPGIAANHAYLADESAGESTVSTGASDQGMARHPSRPAQAPLFDDASADLNHRHFENEFDDFQRQPLLPLRLSQPGPAVAWCDVNDDGRDDLAVGTGAGGSIAVFLGQAQGGWLRAGAPAPTPTAPEARDTTGIVSAPSGGSPQGLWIASSNHEDGRTNGVALRHWAATSVSTSAPPANLLPDLPASAGVLAAADADADGDLDLFIAGRSLPGRYPVPAPSFLMLQDKGQLVPDAVATSLLERAGLVTGAVWTDLDQDGSPELVLACEWGPVRILKRTAGAWGFQRLNVRVADMTLPLDSWTGLWTTLTTGDFDGDGRPDLVVGNRGRNTGQRPTREHPVRLYFGDFDGSGSLEILEASFEASLGKYAPDRDLVSLRQAVPGLVAPFATHAAYAAAGVDEVLGPAASTAGIVEASTVDSFVLLNRTNFFEARPLPAPAQWSPAMGACTADFDGDGDDDLFLAQNNFTAQPLESRQDAGRGLLLLNDGRGTLTASDAAESGIAIYGEQRACATADFDQDGRSDLVVTQNGAATRLFRNRSALPGLRVVVRGTPENPRGVGASLRLRGPRGLGPVREIQSGSGGLAQNSFVTVMGRPPGGSTTLEVLWPGGRREVFPIPENAGTLTVGTRPPPGNP